MKKLVENWNGYMSKIVNFKEQLINSQKAVIIDQFKKVIDEVFDDLEFRVREAILRSKKNYKSNEDTDRPITFANLKDIA